MVATYVYTSRLDWGGELLRLLSSVNGRKEY